MKKVLIPIQFLTVCLLFTFSSCGDDDGPANLPLIGTTWTLVSETTTGCDDPADNLSEECTINCETIVFNEDGTVTFDNDLTGTVTEYEIVGNQITLTISIDFNGQPISVSETINFAINGSQLTLSLTDEDDGCLSTAVYQGS